jgi:hypothetical protein
VAQVDGAIGIGQGTGDQDAAGRLVHALTVLYVNKFATGAGRLQ